MSKNLIRCLSKNKKWKSCERKKRYKSEKTDLKDLKRIQKKGYIIPKNAHAYKCKFCDGWHLGHNKYHDEST